MKAGGGICHPPLDGLALRQRGAEGAPLRDYAIYSALWTHIHRERPEVWLWTDWPEAYRDARSAEVAQFAKEHAREVRFYQFLQWQLDRQLAEVRNPLSLSAIPGW